MKIPPAKLIQKKKKKASKPEIAVKMQATKKQTTPELLTLQQTLGNQTVTRLIQTKLKTGKFGGIYEQESYGKTDESMWIPDAQIFRYAEKEEELIQLMPPTKQIAKKLCKGIFLLLLGKKGSINFYEHEEQHLLQAGNSGVKDKNAIEAGAMYTGIAELDPKDCGKLEFVQNVQSNRKLTFMDGSRLEKTTGWSLDSIDPYPTYLLRELSKDKRKAVYTNDSPNQGTGGLDGFIDTLSVKDNFKLFLMLKQKKRRTTIGLAQWNWYGKVVTTNKDDIDAPLKLESGKIEVPNGAQSDEKPKLSPNIKDEKFKVVGKSKITLASTFEKIFNAK